MRKPLIGLTADVAEDRYLCNAAYARAVAEAGGMPIIFPAVPGLAASYVDLCDGVILTGGDDPRMEAFGVPTHPLAKPLHPDRQATELAILDALAARSRKPALGVCLGMQLMALHAGGRLDQHLPDHLPTAAMHAANAVHRVSGELGDGEVTSHHRQAVVDPGSLRIIARADDGVIEAIASAERRFYIGVQWHPERTADPALGRDLIERLVAAASSARG
jgi:putative glutamine amidotransferase